MIFARVNKQNPCPICGKTDYCQLGDFAVKCTRVESMKPSKDGSGWYHSYGNKIIKPLPSRLKKVEHIEIAAESLMKKLDDETNKESMESLAQSLDVTEKSLYDLCTRFSFAHKAFVFPMSHRTRRKGAKNAKIRKE